MAKRLRVYSKKAPASKKALQPTDQRRQSKGMSLLINSPRGHRSEEEEDDIEDFTSDIEPAAGRQLAPRQMSPPHSKKNQSESTIPPRVKAPQIGHSKNDQSESTIGPRGRSKLDKSELTDQPRAKNPKKKEREAVVISSDSESVSSDDPDEDTQQQPTARSKKQIPRKRNLHSGLKQTKLSWASKERKRSQSVESVASSHTEDVSEDEFNNEDELSMSPEEIAKLAETQADQWIETMGNAPSATQPLKEVNLQKIAPASNVYAAALDTGYHALVQKLWDIEKPLRKALENTPLQMFDDVVTLVAATIPTCLLREVIANNLAHAHLREKKPDVVEVVKAYNDQWVRRNVAVVYQLIIANPLGLSPEAWKWRMILDEMDRYMDYRTTNKKWIDRAYLIDKIGHPQQDRERVAYGARRYVPPRTEDKAKPNMDLPARVRYKHLEPSPEKMQNLRDCLNAMKARVAKAADNEQLPMTYAGYTVNAEERWHHHDTNTHNYALGGVLAVAKFLFPRDDYALQKYVIAPLAAEMEAPIAEVMVCALGNSYYTSGFGFNMADAGESNKSVFKLTVYQQIAAWKWIDRVSPRKNNLKLQIDVLRKEQAEKAARETYLRNAVSRKQAECDDFEARTKEEAHRYLVLKIQVTRLETELNMLHLAKQEIIVSKRKVENELLRGEVERLRRIEQLLEGTLQTAD